MSHSPILTSWTISYYWFYFTKKREVGFITIIDNKLIEMTVNVIYINFRLFIWYLIRKNPIFLHTDVMYVCVYVIRIFILSLPEGTLYWITWSQDWALPRASGAYEILFHTLNEWRQIYFWGDTYVFECIWSTYWKKYFLIYLYWYSLQFASIWYNKTSLFSNISFIMFNTWIF